MIRKLQGVQHCQASRQAGSFSFYGGTRPKRKVDNDWSAEMSWWELAMLIDATSVFAFPSCLRSLALVCKPAEDGESCNSLFILHISILAGDGVSLEGLKNRGRWLLASFIPWPDSYHRVPSPRLCLEKAVRFQRLSITFNWPAWFSAARGVSPVI